MDRDSINNNEKREDKKKSAVDKSIHFRKKKQHRSKRCRSDGLVLGRTETASDDEDITSEASDFLKWMKNPTVQSLAKLRRSIKADDRAWMRDFLQFDGLGLLFQCLSRLTRSTHLSDMVLKLECITCLREVVNSKVGINCILAMKDNTAKNIFGSRFASALDTDNPMLKTQIFEILSAICVYSYSGFLLTLDALEAYKSWQKLPYRFSLLIQQLHSQELATYKANVMALINAIVVASEVIKERMRLRNEFIALGVLDYIAALRREEDASLNVQCDVFEEELAADSDAMLRIHADINITNPNDVFRAIMARTENTPLSASFLSILQSLLQLDYTKARSEVAWLSTEKCVQAQVSRDYGKSSIEQTKLLKGLLPKDASVQTDTANVKLRRRSAVKCKCAVGNRTSSVSDECEITEDCSPLSDTASSVSFVPALPIAYVTQNNFPAVPGAASLPVSTITSPSPPSSGPHSNDSSPTMTLPPLPPPPPIGIPGAPIPPPPPGGSPGAPPPPAPAGRIPGPPPPPCGIPGAPPPPPPPPPPGGIIGVPPPPPPPGGIPTQSLTPQTPKLKSIETPQPQCKMKILPWNKITPPSCDENNIWKDVLGMKDVIEIRYGDIEKFFCQKESTERPPGSHMDRQKRMSSSQHEITLIDAKKSMNLNIFLKQFRKSNEDIIDILKRSDERTFGAEKLKSLQKLLPTPDEIELVKTFDGASSQLGNAENFYQLLVQLPAYRLLISTMILRSEFGSQMSYIRPCIASVIHACRLLYDNPALKTFLRYVLHTGNFINKGSNAGGAVGFRVSYLNKLANTKSNQVNYTLLHYLIDSAHRQNPASLKFIDDLSDVLHKACRTPIEGILNEYKTMKTNLKQVKTQLDTSPEDIANKFVSFLEEAESDVIEMDECVERLASHTTRVAQHYCENTRSFKLDEFLTSFRDFGDKVKVCQQENESRRREADNAETRRQTMGMSNGVKKVNEDSKIVDRLVDEMKRGKVLRRLSLKKKKDTPYTPSGRPAIKI